MTQEIYLKAMRFAGEKHSKQKVPGTEANYLLHISSVAMEILLAHSYSKDFDLEFALQMAILHDTIEDTDTSYEEVEAAFGILVAKGVLALTKNNSLPSKKERMLDSLNRINRLEKEVGMVKLADRITNLQKPPHYWSKDKSLKYLEEAKIISDALATKNEYLNKRLLDKIREYTKYV